MKLAGTIILYYPEEKVLENVQSYLEQIEKLYVVDNTENNQTELIKDILQFSKVTFLHDGINKGIASRLNQVCKLAIEDGYEWLLTMDQDSSFEADFLKKYITCTA